MGAIQKMKSVADAVAKQMAERNGHSPAPARQSQNERKHVEVAAPARPMMMERQPPMPYGFQGHGQRLGGSNIQHLVARHKCKTGHARDALAKAHGDVAMASCLITEDLAAMSAPPEMTETIPGDVWKLWTCTACTFENAPHLTLCQMCKTPKEGPNMMEASTESIMPTTEMTIPADTWTCTGCTFENAGCMTWCEVCNEPKGVRKIKTVRTVDLEEKGRLLGYKPVDVIGDGSCQFRSIIMALEEEEGKHNRGTEWTHLKLRQACVKWMRENEDLRMDQENNMGEETTLCQATWLDGKTWDEYLKDMERPTTWGDEGTLLVACVVLRARIGVISNLEASKGMYYTTPPAHWKIPEDRTLEVFHLHENHYKYAKKL